MGTELRRVKVDFSGKTRKTRSVSAYSAMTSIKTNLLILSEFLALYYWAICDGVRVTTFLSKFNYKRTNVEIYVIVVSASCHQGHTPWSNPRRYLAVPS